MRSSQMTRMLLAAAIAAGATLSTAVPPASAAPCPDVEVLFARGTGEAPGVGGVGQGFVDALRAQLGPESVDVYPIDYAASGDYSQGAVVAGYVTSAQAPTGVPSSLVPKPLPPNVADHVATVALFGKPSQAFLQQYDAPNLILGPAFAPKTIDLCAQGDTICDGSPDGQPTLAHAS